MIMGFSMAAAGANTVPTTPPTGLPRLAYTYLYGASLTAINWTNGDPRAETEIGYRADESAVLEPTSVTEKVAAGVTSWESGDWPRCHFWVRHLRGGTRTAWVLVTNAYGCDIIEGGPE